MDEFLIELQAKLDEAKSKGNINSDIDKIQSQIDKLKIQAEIDPKAISNLVKQLESVLNQKINISNININAGQTTKAAQQVGQKMGQQIQSGINSAIQKENLQKDFFFSADKKNDAAKRAQEYFRGISNGIVTVTEQMENLDNKSELRGFIINIKNAKGEVESLKYSLRNILDDNGNVTGQKFAYVSGSINDANTIKQFEEINKVITDYEIKLANLKTKYSNANVDYNGFDEVFENFKLGIATTNELALAFNQLENSAKKGVQSLKSQSSSFDPIQQTLNNMRDLPSMLTTLEANMGGIKDKTSIAEISVADLRKTFNELETEMTNSGGKIPLTDEWLTKNRELMSTVTSATKQVDALKKAEASDNSQTQKQANYYSTLLSNYREIYSLKKKLINAGEEETKVIKEQIRSLNSSNASINNQLGKQGLKDNDWQSQVDDLKEELDYSLRISEARQKDKVTQSNLNDAQRESIQIVEELEQAYQRVQNIKVKIASLDKEKDGEKISTLSQEEKTAQDEYNQLYNKLRKRKNYDKESWDETKSAIDAATKSQIEFNNAKSQDTLNKAQKTEVSDFNILKDKWKEQGVLVGEFKAKVEQMESALASVGSKGELDNLKLQIKDLKTEADRIAEVNKIQLLSNGGIKDDYSTQIAKLEGNFRSLGLTEDNIQAKTSNVTTAFDALKTRINQPFDESNYQEIISLNDKLQKELIESGNEYTKLQSSAKGFVSMQQRLSKANTIEAWNQKNSAATKQTIATNEAYIASLRDLNTQMTKMQFNEIADGFKKSENSMRSLGKLGASFKEQMSQAAESFTQWASVSSAIMLVVSKTKSAITDLKEINSILTEISKTADQLTKSDLVNLGESAFSKASKYGKQASDYLTGIQEMYRAGYENSEELAELSTLAQAAGDMEADLANDYLIATDAAYKLKGNAEKLNEVLDGQNYITNRNALSMKDLAEATRIAASQSASSGIAIDKSTAALGTMIATTRQGGDIAARAWKGILMNIQQVEGEVEDGEIIDADSLSKYEKACEALGVSLKEVKDGVISLRDPMQILKELSKAYTALDESDARRANLISAVGGKYRGNQLNALLENWDLYEKMLQDYASGSDSAMEEAMKSANNWEGSINRLGNTFTKVVSNIVKSDEVITIADFFNTLLSGVDKLTSALGSLGTIGAISGGIAGAKNWG